MTDFRLSPGSRYPTGAFWDGKGTNFSVFSRHATAVELVLYERAENPAPIRVIKLDPRTNRTFFFWHVYLEGLGPGIHYTWRMDGPNDIRSSGHRFNRDRELVDPWARGVTATLWNRVRACSPGAKGVPSIRGMVVDTSYDWQDDQPLNRAPEDSIIYELHVGGFTKHPSAGVKYPGTFHAIIEKIPYLKDLGITDVELLPIMAFDEQDLPDGTRNRGLKNFWGYSTHSYYSPHPRYCVSPERGTHLREFRDMVKALHKAGIGVIMDVVFNHTAEGDASGPVINFKGIGNSTFYHLEPHDRSIYRDYAGCGNTFNCNHPLVAAFIVDCLEFWVREMHVDGFRFDLASVLTRGEDGNPMYHAPVLWHIEFSDVLAHSRVIAEAWDATGLYQVGAFPGYRWAEWNGQYRDVMRRFVRGDRGIVGEVASRIAGSSDLYQKGGRLPTNSVNFVTCHDGFTLRDLVSYHGKRNHANGEGNRDGSDHNLSWNCGIEGETRNTAVTKLRTRQAKNFVAILLLSQGVPMLLSGDEVLRTQWGNNNAYCQDNRIGWFDWTLTDSNRDMLRFVREMISFRKRHRCVMRSRFLTGLREQGSRLPDVTWHGEKLHKPPWDDADAQKLAFTLGRTSSDEEDLHVMLNMSDHPRRMGLPRVPERQWHRAIDTWEPAPIDIQEPRHQTPINEHTYLVRAHSVVVLESRTVPE